MTDPNDYFNGSVIGVATGVLCAGIPTVATTWRSGRHTPRLPSEPGFSVGLILIYVPCAYGIGGLFSILSRSSDPLLNAALSLIGWIAAHLTYLAGRRARHVDADVKSFAGITAVYLPSDSAELRTQLRQDLRGVSRVRVMAPNINELLTGDHSAIGDALREATAGGLQLEILADSSDRRNLSSGPLSGQKVVGTDPVDWPPAWLIVTVGRVLYFGLFPDARSSGQMPVFRGECSPGDGVLQLADAVHAVTDMMFTEAQGQAGFGKIVTCSSPKEYRQRIVSAEAGAATVDRLPKRLSVIFKSETTVRSIAEQRFGPGSRSVSEYVEEHDARRAEFFAALARGMVCREIYNEKELITYVSSRRHSSAVELSQNDMLETVLRWREAVALHRNYVVGITADPLPLKYELVDERLVVMHEAIGVSDSHRLNAIFVHSAMTGSAFGRDFDTIWDRISAGHRERTNVLQFIDEVLLPLAGERAGR